MCVYFYYRVDESVIIQSHLYSVSASVYPRIPVGAVDEFAFNLLDHNVVVWVRSTKYVTREVPRSTIRAMSKRTNIPMDDLARSCFDSILHSSSYVSMTNWWNCCSPRRRVSMLPKAGLQTSAVRRVPRLSMSLRCDVVESVHQLLRMLSTDLSSSSV